MIKKNVPMKQKTIVKMSINIIKCNKYVMSLTTKYL